MSSETRQLLEQALKRLSLKERAELASELIASLDDPPDAGVEEAWADEMKRRVAEVRAGKVKTVRWADAEQRILKRLEAVRRT
jgi:putative addiction module component (TIGR02574 family)